MTQRVVVVGATGQLGRPDEVAVIGFALPQPGISGPVNLTAREPVQSRQFARSLGQVASHRAWRPVPTPFVRMGLGVVTDILVRVKRVIPAQASAVGYQFAFPVLETALRNLVLGGPGA